GRLRRADLRTKQSSCKEPLAFLRREVGMQSRHMQLVVWSLSLVGLLALSVCALAQGQAKKKVSLPAVEKDLPYAKGGDQQMLDLYMPDKESFVTIVFIYGGGWHSGSRKSVTPIGEMFQRRGYGCALLSHRLSPKDKFPAQAEDVAA